MEDQITYGAFWKTDESEDYKPFSCWFSNFSDAYKEACIAMKNPRCIATRVVERVETFEVTSEWYREKKEG